MRSGIVLAGDPASSRSHRLLHDMGLAHPAWAADLARLGPFAAPERPPHPALTARPCLAGAPQIAPPVLAVLDTDSTMDECWALLAAEGSAEPGDRLPDFTAVLAVRQRAGRGQLRRPWTSPAGNLHVSFLWPTTPPGPDPGWDRLLPLAAGWIVLRALEAVAGPEAGLAIKWPNDLVARDRKVGGMLLEEKGGRLVLGLGVNLVGAPDRAAMRRDAALEAGILALPADAPGPLGLWSMLVKFLQNEYVLLSQATPAALLSLISRRLLWLGKRVTYHDAGQEAFDATIIGLSPDGGLMISCGGTVRTVYTGGILPA
ncbi:MAG: biotin--[acetyl-CoA-carboxylase] ligase [Desulfovibrionaceae bacterium]